MGVCLKKIDEPPTKVHSEKKHLRMERTYQMMLVDHSKVNSDVTSGERDFPPHPLSGTCQKLLEKIGWKRCFFIHPAVKNMPSTSPRFGSCIAAFAGLFRNQLLLRVPWVELQGELNARCSASSAKQQGPTSGFRCNILIYFFGTY